MNTNKQLRKKVVPAVMIAAIVYFAFYTLYGNRGLYRMFELQDEIVIAETHRVAALREREDVERRVTLMRPKTLDLDMLNETVRETLRYTHPDDIIVEF